MIFYQSPASKSQSAGPSVRTLRVAVLVALAAYPAGALIRLLAPDTSAGKAVALVGGFGLILVSLIAAAIVVGSRLHRIAADEDKRLDEMELQLRHKALSWSYAVFAGALLAALLYAGMAMDGGWWLPSTYEHWSGLFWGALLYITLLPTARLAWMMDPADEQED